MASLISRDKSYFGIPGALCWITLTALICGSIANLVSPNKIPWSEDWSHYIEAKALEGGITLITSAQAWERFEKGTAIFLDARPNTDYETGHIPSALSLPYDAIEDHFMNVQMLLTPEQPIVTYCSGEECDESFLLTTFLRDQGFTNVVLFAGGIEAWKKSGYPEEGGR